MSGSCRSCVVCPCHKVGFVVAGSLGDPVADKAPVRKSQSPAGAVFVCYIENHSVATSLKCQRRREIPGGGGLCRRLFNRERLRVRPVAVRPRPGDRDDPPALRGGRVGPEVHDDRPRNFIEVDGCPLECAGNFRRQPCEVLGGEKLRDTRGRGRDAERIL